MVWCKIFEYHKMRAVRSMISQKFDGGDVDENRHFIEGKLVAHGQIFNIFQNFPRCEQLGGDASGNGDFQRRKQRLQGPNVFRSFHFIFSKK